MGLAPAAGDPCVCMARGMYMGEGTFWMLPYGEGRVVDDGPSCEDKTVNGFPTAVRPPPPGVWVHWEGEGVGSWWMVPSRGYNTRAGRTPPESGPLTSHQGNLLSSVSKLAQTQHFFAVAGSGNRLRVTTAVNRHQIWRRRAWCVGGRTPTGDAVLTLRWWLFRCAPKSC